MEVLQKSFYDRAFWDVDDFGQRWIVLHRRTDEIKNSGYDTYKEEPIPNQPQLSGKFENKRKLSPAQLKEYKAKFREVLESGKSGSSIRQAGRKALKDITLVDLGYRVSFDGDKIIPRTPINIRTGRLAAALSPAEVAGNRIYGGPDQDFRLDGLTVHFSLAKIPYAEEVENISKTVQRPIITEAHIGAVFASHKPAINAAKTEYNRVLTQMERNNDRGQTDRSSNR
jgi:hypothetical protein